MSRSRVLKLQKLLLTEQAEIDSSPEGNNTPSDKHLKKRLPTIKCVCGAEILLVPDLQAMNRAINTHVAQHRKTERKNPQQNEIKPIEVSELLSQRTITKISQQNAT
jgi:hypothetical protein